MDTGEVVALKCKRKWCPFCAERRRRQYVAHYTAVFRDLPALHAASLTIDPKSLSTDDSAVVRGVLVKQLWLQFRKAMHATCKESGTTFTYVGAPERHGRGFWHVHALVSCPIDDACERMMEAWFKVGGGAVLAVEPVYGGERGIARWTGYVFKQWFGPFAPRNAQLLVSRGIGYESAWAKERRKAYVVDRDRYVFEPSPEWLDREPAARVRAAFPVAAIELDLGRRSGRYVALVDGASFGVEVRVEEGGARHYAVVEVQWDERRQQRRYEPLSEHETRACADAEVKRLVAADATTQAEQDPTGR